MASRRLTQVLTAGAMSALAVGGFAPTLANAASNNDTVTVAGGGSYTYTFNQSPSIQAVAQPNCRPLSAAGNVTLMISGPGVTSSTLVSHKGDCRKAVTLSPSAGSVNTRHPAWTGGSTMASNGVYTVSLDNQGRTTSASFTLTIPPAKVSGFAVNPADSGTTAYFAWVANSEPDLIGYQINDASGNALTTVPTSVCSGSTCGATLDLGSSVAGHTEHYSIVALRSCGIACSAGHIASASAAKSSATFAAAPTPTPSVTPTKSSGTGGGDSQDGGTVGTVKTGGHHSGGVDLGNADAAGQVSHNLPPASVNSAPQVNAPPLPSVHTSIRPLDLGAKPGKIKYPPPLLANKSAADKGLAHDIKSGLTLPPLWRGIAAAAVLILIAIHLRAWVARTEAF